MSIRDRSILSAPADLDIQHDDGRYQMACAPPTLWRR